MVANDSDEQASFGLRLRRSVWWLLPTVLAGGLCVVAVGHLIPLGVPGEWVWPYINGQPSAWFMAPSALFATLWLFAAATLWTGVARGKVGRGWIVVCCLISTLILRGAVQFAGDPDMIGPGYMGLVVASPLATSYFYETRRIDRVGAWLRRFDGEVKQYSEHASTKPPGAILTFWTLRHLLATGHLDSKIAGTWRMLTGDDTQQWVRFAQQRMSFPVTPAELDSAAAVGLVLSLLGALGVIPLCLLAGELSPDATTAPRWTYLSGITFALCPALNLFQPGIDQLVATVTLTALWCFARSLQTDSRRWAFAAGAVTGIGLLIHTATAVVPVIAGFMLAVRFLVMDRRQRSVARTFVPLAFLCGGALIPILGMLPAGYNFFHSLPILMSHHKDVTEGRSYLHWLLGDPVDFLVFAGIAPAWWWLTKRRADWRAGSPAALTDAAMVAVLTLLVLSGTARGEVARIWMFLMPPLFPLAAAAIADDAAAAAWQLWLPLYLQLMGILLLRLNVVFIAP